MSDVRRLIRDIDRGKNLQKNLPAYRNLLADTYLDYAAVELVFSSYLLVDSLPEYHGLSPEERALYEEVISWLRRLTGISREEISKALEEIQKVRDQITKRMEQYTFYTDRLICYEYVLDRMKLRFTEDKEIEGRLEDIQEEEFIKQLMAFVVAHEDQSIVRDRLQSLMGILPVHMTKNKLLEKIEQTVTLYKGSDVASLEGFAYMIRSAAMLHPLDESTDDEIDSLLTELESTDFKELDADTYKKLCDKLEQVSERICEITDFYYSLQKVVNGCYAFGLVKLHNDKNTETQKISHRILSAVVKGELEEEELEKLEGRIEECVEKSSYLEAVLFEVKSSCKEILRDLELEQEFEDYARIANLLSDSLFVDLAADNQEIIVDEQKAAQVAAELAEELSRKLAECKRPVKKAVMAAVLEKLPAGFPGTREVEEYIRTNLFGCQDISEKAAAILELEQMMSEAEYWQRPDSL
ncbi:MAG: hypothetical protein HFG34_08585 [Eubacterium sp.]|nr:hypothetical protein [Eubacterium sp.]